MSTKDPHGFVPGAPTRNLIVKPQVKKAKVKKPEPKSNEK